MEATIASSLSAFEAVEAVVVCRYRRCNLRCPSLDFPAVGRDDGDGAGPAATIDAEGVGWFFAAEHLKIAVLVVRLRHNMISAPVSFDTSACG
jgi:hypothetical protein